MREFRSVFASLFTFKEPSNPKVMAMEERSGVSAMKVENSFGKAVYGEIDDQTRV
jgi:hypothetical protein